MWTRRKLFPTLDVPATPHVAAVATPAFRQQQTSSNAGLTLDESDYNFVASLAYTLVPGLGAQEAAQLLTWVVPPSWVQSSDKTASTSNAEAEARYKAVVSSLVQQAAVLQACSQVEYFMLGTDNGQVFLMPLLPPHLLHVLLTEVGAEALPGLAEAQRREVRLMQTTAATPTVAAAPPRVPVNCVGRRLLHRHVREEPVTALDHLGVLCASAASSADNAVALSVFHPSPSGVVCLPHPCPVRSLKLWEGTAFTTDTANMDGLQQRWGQHVQEAEPVAVYVFTGDDAGVVRLWRVDVVARTYALQHVLVCSTNMASMLSPLSPFAREDTTRRVPARDADRVVHCLDIDVAANRLFGGTEGGVFVWALDALPWRGPDAVSSSEEEHTPAHYAVRHPFCWDEAQRSPLPCALQCWAAAQSDTDGAAPSSSSAAESEKVVEYRAARLVNHHVWILDAPLVQAEMKRAQEHEQQQAASAEERVSGWKPKYGRVLTNGAAVGVVSNTVRLVDGGAESGVAARLTRTTVSVIFDGGEVKNELRVPLSCVVPVHYPLTFLRTPGTACFALRVLAPQDRLLTSCADGKVCMWARKADHDAAESYVPRLLTDNKQAHRGLGRHLCVLRSPDVFVSCSFDDGLVKEWHVYDEPELLLRCARRFTLTPFVSDRTRNDGGGAFGARELADMFKGVTQAAEEKQKQPAGASSEDDDAEDADRGDVVVGISCAAAYPAFGALFLVGAFESAIQAYSLTEVVGCEPPRNFIYNGHKTVHLPSSMAEDVYHEL